MTKEINTEIKINASAQKVWEVFANFDDYSSWNPFIKSLKGEVSTGNKIEVRIQPPNGREMTFNPEIISYEPTKKLVWLGHLFFSGLFDGEHYFEIIDQGDGNVVFKHGEKFRGILVWMLNIENTIKGFCLMNEKLKELAEQ